MAVPKKPSRAMILVTKLRPGVVEGRSPALVKMVAALDSAEAEACLAPGAARRAYLVNYRVGGATTQSKGPPDARRSDLVALIESRNPFEAHASTSSWIVRSFLEAAGLLALLSAPLDKGHDFLLVARVGSDRAKFGDSGLKS